MKKTYEKPVLSRTSTLSRITARISEIVYEPKP